MLFVHKINMNLDKQETKARIGAVKGDANTRAVEISLYNNQTPWQIPAGTGCVIRYKKSDGHGGVYSSLPDGEDAWHVDENKLMIFLAPHVLNVNGLVEVSAALTLGESILGIFTFEVQVECDPSDGLAESIDYFEYQDLQQINAALSGAFALLETDKSLTIDSKPADAKVVGATLSGKVNKSGDRVDGYLDFGTQSNGIMWKTADDSIIRLRPYSPENVFQLTMENPANEITEFGVLTIGTNGNWQFSHPDNVRNAIGASQQGHSHDYSDLTNRPIIPTSLPANGGNADTLDGKHAADFVAATNYANRIAQRCYCVTGIVLNGINNCSIGGAGSVAIDISPSGVARIDFSLQIITSGTNEYSFSDYGINRDLFRVINANVPQIVPLTGGCYTAFDSDGSVVGATTGMGGTFSGVNQFWVPSRVYEISTEDTLTGHIGAWAEVTFPQGTRLIGTCYGTVIL